MDDLEDNTAVIQMKQAFQQFMPNTGVRGRLSFSNSTVDVSGYEGNRSAQSSVSMQQLFVKERLDREKQAELIRAKTTINELQGKLDSAETSRKRTRFEFEKDVDSIKQEHFRDRESLLNLKGQMDLLLKKDEETQIELKEMRSELVKTKSAYEHKILFLQKDKYKLEMQLQELEHMSGNRQLELKNNNLRKDSELQICKLELEELKSQMQNTLKRYTDVSRELQEAEEHRGQALAAEQKIKDLENQISKMENDAVVARTMKSQLDKLKDMEKENRALRHENDYYKETQENAFLLREENESLKKKLERSEERCLDCNELQLANQEMKKVLTQWEKLNDSTGKTLSPIVLTRHVSDLQMSNASLLQRQGHLQTSAHVLEGTLQSKAQELKGTQDVLAQIKIKSQQQEQLIKRLNKKLLLVSKERDSYKNIIDSYESEMTVSICTPKPSQFSKLQEVLQGCQRQVASLEAELQRAEGDLVQAQSRAKMLENEVRNSRQSQRMPSVADADQSVIAQLREQVAGLEKKLEEADLEKQDLESRMERRHLQGDYDPARTKVIHFSMNPVSVAQKRRAEEFSVIKEENKKLKTRLQLLEEAEGACDDLTQQVQTKLETPVSSQEIEDLRTQIKSAELKNQRLMEVFKKKSHELREAVYQLLGFMIHLPSDNMYRLINMYAESANDYLLFQQNSDGQLQLLATDYSSTLEDKIDTYLTTRNSIPAFLCSITTELFSRQTMLT